MTLTSTQGRKTFFPTPLLVLWLTVAGPIAPSVRAGEQTEGPLGPSVLVASGDAKTLYVACLDSRQVLWVDLSSAKVTRRVDVPGEPTGLAINPDGTKLIVTCAAAQSTLAVLDAASGELLRAIPAGHTAMSPVVSPDGARIYVCNRFDNDVSVIDAATGKELARVAVVREPISAALTPDGRFLLVANHLPNVRTNIDLPGEVRPVVTRIDTETLETTAIRLPSGSSSLRSLRVAPDGKHAFVTHLLANFQEIPFRVDTGWVNVNVLSVIDTQEARVISTIGLDEYYLGSGNPWDIIFTADGQTVCVSLAGAHEVCLIGASELLGDFARRTMQPMMGVWPIYLSLGESLWRRKQMPGRGPRGLAAAGTKIYVAQYFSDSLAVIDPQAQDDRGVETIALGPPPRPTPQRLGEQLFHDADICYQQWLSCSSCHPDGRMDSLNWDLMNDGTGNPKNTKSMLLAHKTPPAMAEAVRPSAEVAVRAGLVHILFAERPEQEAAAIDAYLKSLRPVPSPHLVQGRLSPAAQRGRLLFEGEPVGCQRCHPGPLYTDLRTHNVGTWSPKQRNRVFDTPTLIEVWRTAPYLHDGRYTTIRELLTEGGHGLGGGQVADLSDQEIHDLVEFVLSL